MLSNTMFVILFSVIAVSSAVELITQRTEGTNEQTADGSRSFDYYAQETKEAACKILQYFKDLDAGLADFTDTLKKNNTDSTVLSEYQEAFNSVEGTNCEVNENIDNAQNAIEDIVTTCANDVPDRYRDELDRKVTNSLAKIQAIDNNLKLNSNLCQSRIASPLPTCVEQRDKDIERLKQVLSNEEQAQLSYYQRDVYLKSIAFMEACVQISTELQEKDFVLKIEEIEKCKNSI